MARWYRLRYRQTVSTAEIIANAPRRYRGMADWQPPLTAARATAGAASRRLFGEAIPEPTEGSHRGEYLRFVLRSIYGADYHRRGAGLLGVDAARLSGMLTGGERVSRRVVDRLADKLANRVRNRRKELRRAGVAIESAFAAEHAALERCPEMVAALLRLASVAANTRQPHSRETGRFVSRRQGKEPELREASPIRKNRKNRA